MFYPPKYPSTPHWPLSMSKGRDDKLLKDPSLFLGQEVVITEKLDGSNVALWKGNVYSRSTGQPANEGWYGMVKKYHAWKTVGSDVDHVIYGEDIAAKHSLDYTVDKSQTFNGFAIRRVNHDAPNTPENGWFLHWDATVKELNELGFNRVPVLFRGKFNDMNEVAQFFNDHLGKPSAFGIEKEGFVMRVVNAFQATDFATSVCKFVRPNHVQTDKHWRQSWTWNGLT